MKTKINEVPKDNLLMVENGGIVVITLFKNVVKLEGEDSGYEADTVSFSLRPETNLRERVLAKFDWYWDRTIAAVLNEAKARKIIELKELLASSDFYALKHTEGALSEAMWNEAKTTRAAWRKAINDIEACTTLSEVEAITYPDKIKKIQE